MFTGGEQHRHGGRWLREVVFGLSDGLVTTLVFVLAVSGLAHAQLVLVAVGELLAGGISMGLGGYLSARTERAIVQQQIATERYEIANEPDEEKAELRQIYFDKGVRGPLLDRLVRHLTADQDRWLGAMVRDELGIVDAEADLAPWLQGAMIGGSFAGGALVPIFPFILDLPDAPVWAYGLTVATSLLLGVVKARYTYRGAIYNGLEFLAITTVGALAGLGIGALLRLVAGGG
jgi:VIT1/CCC1 family predicted Fe2+/Mn2+ transporter